MAMKTCILICLIPLNLFAVPERNVTSSQDEFKYLDSLVTNKGKEYVKVTIQELTPSGIKIIHQSGVVTIRFEDLSKELQESLGGFDAELARKYREEESRIREQRAKAHARSMARDSEIIRQRQEQQRQEEIFEQSKIPARFIITQIVDGGALCSVSVKSEQLFRYEVPRALGGCDIKWKRKWVWSCFSEELYFVSGLPSHLVDDDSWEDWVVISENYTYSNALGEQKTVRKLEVVGGRKY
jgi:hypothetical protein